MTRVAPLEAVLKRDRWMVLAGLAGTTAIAWGYLATIEGDMDGMAMPEMGAWSATDALQMFVMWSVMMVGMMLPSAAPMILLHAAVRRRRARRSLVFAPTGVFATGYVVAWTLFSIVATGAQWGLEQAALASPAIIGTSPYLGGALLIAAGLYQWTWLKHACLEHCRSPVEFLSRIWRDGTGGALTMGLHHGIYCIGCCWALMALLFVLGVMNLLWVATLTAIVFIEKIVPGGHLFARVAGGLSVAAGVYLVIMA